MTPLHRHLPWLLASLVTGLAGAQGAPAQQVWRCGPNGDVYSDAPCPEGRRVNAHDPRSAAERAAGRDVAQRDRQLARDLAAEREARHREAAAHGSGLATLGAAPPPVKATKAKGKGKKPKQPRSATSPAPDPDTLRAVGPASR